jgi:hypothetical protein
MPITITANERRGPIGHRLVIILGILLVLLLGLPIYVWFSPRPFGVGPYLVGGPNCTDPRIRGRMEQYLATREMGSALASSVARNMPGSLQAADAKTALAHTRRQAAALKPRWAGFGLIVVDR